MEKAMVKREVVAMCMESPLYFTMPLWKRLILLKKLEHKSSSQHLRDNFLSWVKTGNFDHPAKIPSTNLTEEKD
jgi:hypothetical protein